MRLRDYLANMRASRKVSTANNGANARQLSSSHSQRSGLSFIPDVDLSWMWMAVFSFSSLTCSLSLNEHLSLDLTPPRSSHQAKHYHHHQ